jgi:AcrR family transcriptional regulator
LPSRVVDQVEPITRRRKRGEAKAIILTVAQRLFAERGYANTSMREVAEQAEVAEALIFRHFGSKAGLFTASVTEVFGQFLESFASDLSGKLAEQSVETLMRSYIETLYETARANRDVLITLISAAQFESEVLGNLYEDVGLSATIDAVRPATEEGIEALHLRAPDYDVQLRAVFAMVVGLALLDPWIMPKPPRRPSRARIIDEMVATVLHGLLNPDLLPDEI